MRALMTILLAMVALATTVGGSFAATCDQLWVERNSYYKAAGYCFETQRAISYFGNGGCTVHNQNAVRLSRAAQNRISEIVRRERAQGCSD